jgi:hypothetical protein
VFLEDAELFADIDRNDRVGVRRRLMPNVARTKASAATKRPRVKFSTMASSARWSGASVVMRR